MKLGLIARADQSGLAIQTWEFYQHMHPDKTMVIDVSEFYNEGDDCNKKTDLGLYPNADIIVKGWEPSPSQINSFLDGLDAVYSAETPYGWDLVHHANQQNIRTYIHVNPEFCQHLVIPTLIKPTLLMLPTPWLYDRIPDPKRVVPVPIATERFAAQSPHDAFFQKNTPAKNFLHVVGRPAAYDRNGTLELLRALQHVREPINVTFSCLRAGYIIDVMRAVDIPDHVHIDIDESQYHDYWSVYQGQDVLIMPRRWGGMSLPMQEAIGAGMPVIMSANDVYAKHVPCDWTVTSRYASAFQARTRIDVHAVDVQALAACIDKFASDEQAMISGCTVAQYWAKKLSWQTLKPLYDSVLTSEPMPAR